MIKRAKPAMPLRLATLLIIQLLVTQASVLAQGNGAGQGGALVADPAPDMRDIPDLVGGGEEIPEALPDEYRETMAHQYQFSDWPGKDLMPKRGLALEAADLPALSGLAIKRRIDSDGRAATLTLECESAVCAFTLSTQVHASSTDAHEALLTELSNCSGIVGRDTSSDVQLGDIGYVTLRQVGAQRQVSYAAFVRRNVFIQFNQLRQDQACDDYLGLLKHLDGMVSEQPDLMPNQAAGLDPRITVLEVVPPEIRLASPPVAHLAQVRIEAASAEGDPCTLCFTESAIYPHDRGNGLYELQGHPAPEVINGTVLLRVIAVDAWLRLTVKELRIPVSES